jgi:class 3 adenylate cyclase
MAIGVAELEAAGLYDAALPGSQERLALLQWLIENGATTDQLRRAAGAGSFADLAVDLARGTGPRLTLNELSARTGVRADQIQAVRFAAGLPPVGPDDPVLVEDDATVVSDLATGETMFGRDPLRRFQQMLGTSLARIAEAAVSLSLVHIEAPMRAAGASELTLVQGRFRAVQTSRPLVTAIGKLFRAHLEAAGVRGRDAIPHGGSTASLSIGFVDLVGFTTLARRVHRQALVQIIERFEETAHDVAASGGGRVVKFVGDEVMFVTSGARAACDIALTLIDRFAGDPSVTPRGGLAQGEVLVRGGDYYGPIVNLAARLAEHAVPSEVLVTEAVASDSMADAVRFEPAGRRILKGFDEPIRVFTATRGAN